MSCGGRGRAAHLVQGPGPGTWDLTRNPNSLALAFTHTMSGNLPESGAAWAEHRQPIVLLCSENGMTRYVPSMDGGTTPLLPYAGAPVDTVLPIGRGSVGGWVEVNTNLDLRRVKRVEILLEP